jgi:hypothetical protein
VIGLVEWEIGPEGDRAIGEVHAIHVATEERGRGVATVLLAAAVEAMRSLGVRRAVLWVLAANAAARRFYESIGWTWDGTIVERPLGDFADFPPRDRVPVRPRPRSCPRRTGVVAAPGRPVRLPSSEESRALGARMHDRWGILSGHGQSARGSVRQTRARR